MSKKKDAVFIEITNEDIYKKLNQVDIRGEEILKQVLETNGKVKMHQKWLIGLTVVVGFTTLAVFAPQLQPLFLKLIGFFL